MKEIITINDFNKFQGLIFDERLKQANISDNLWLQSCWIKYYQKWVKDRRTRRIWLKFSYQ